MPKKVFASFHYVPDNWRVSQVRNIGAVEGSPAISDNDWETVTKGGDAAIQKWIDNQLFGRSCTVVMIGANTAGRKWIGYEILKSWNDRKGLVGVHIHNLLDRHGNQTLMGANPFGHFNVGTTNMSNIVKTYNPPYLASTDVYGYIKDNLEKWVDEAVQIRANH